jgi:hypothetical protein
MLHARASLSVLPMSKVEASDLPAKLASNDDAVMA